MRMRNIMLATLLGASVVANAQDTYLNDRLTATDDVIGSARYVGMGGALGALGADISVSSSNPAGLGLYRRSEVGLTFGAVVPTGGGWLKSEVKGEKLAKGSFDQLGFVWSIKLDGDKLKYVNFATNYQKKANYNMGFFADNMHLGGLSQMDQLAELATGVNGESYMSDYNLAGLAAVPYTDPEDPTVNNYYLNHDATNNTYSNYDRSGSNKYARHQWGSLQSYDVNISFNVKDRFYTGLTMGLDNIDYSSWSDYMEYKLDGTENYALRNDRDISGHGVNVKVGFILRPIKNDPLRVGLAIETPTWYRVQNSTYMWLDNSEEVESYLEYTMHTPWRARLSLGSTVDKYLAWGVEYEYANIAKTRMGFPTYNGYDGPASSYANTGDYAMNLHTEDIMRGQHTLKLGLEVKPIDEVALRVGYNFVSSRYKKNPTFDQFNIESPAMNYTTNTDFMSLGATNIFTFGLGYKYKKFFADIAYKYRTQSGDFYAFDTGFSKGGQFRTDNPMLPTSIDPVNVNMNRHHVQLSLGFKF